eukprot:15383996-Alexandrium_andersonii.AAC.1
MAPTTIPCWLSGRPPSFLLDNRPGSGNLRGVGNAGDGKDVPLRGPRGRQLSGCSGGFGAVQHLLAGPAPRAGS